MLTWPADFPAPFSGGVAPFLRSLSGGQSLSGFEQVQPQFHDRWSALFSFHLNTDARVLALRNMLTQLRGRANTIGVPAFDRSRAPYGLVGGGLVVGATLNNPPFWERWPTLAGTSSEFTALAITGTATILGADSVAFVATAGTPQAGYWITIESVKREIVSIEGSGPYILILRRRDDASGSGTITAALHANAALNATSVDIIFSAGGPPLPGHLFSLGARLYAIDSVTALSATISRVSIWPWLRTDYLSGAAADFVTPVCEMRLASDAEGADALRSLRLGKYGDVSLAFDEVA